jgi:hypothetical protein
MLHHPRIHLYTQGAIESAFEAAELLGVPRTFMAGRKMQAQFGVVIGRFG